MNSSDNTTLIPPYGEKLVDLLVGDELREHATRLPSVQLSERAVCDLEMLATGAFSPLDRFMGREDFRRVVEEMRLVSGHIFPLPVTLPVKLDAELSKAEEVALRSSKNELLAVMTVEEVYDWSLDDTAAKVFGTRDLRHPLVAEMHRWGRANISGRLRVLQLPRHYDFLDLRLSPAETRARLETFGHANVVAFQTRNPLHRVHEELTKRAIPDAHDVTHLQPPNIPQLVRTGKLASGRNCRRGKSTSWSWQLRQT
jgi:sulfate adenylyltransferase